VPASFTTLEREPLHEGGRVLGISADAPKGADVSHICKLERAYALAREKTKVRSGYQDFFNLLEGRLPQPYLNSWNMPVGKSDWSLL